MQRVVEVIDNILEPNNEPGWEAFGEVCTIMYCAKTRDQGALFQPIADLHDLLFLGTLIGFFGVVE